MKLDYNYQQLSIQESHLHACMCEHVCASMHLCERRKGNVRVDDCVCVCVRACVCVCVVRSALPLAPHTL